MGRHLYRIDEHTLFRKNYLYPETGGIKIELESTAPIDVYFADTQTANLIHSKSDAEANLREHLYLHREELRKEFGVPDSWENGWQMIIGNPNNEAVVVYARIKKEVVLGPNLFGVTE